MFLLPIIVTFIAIFVAALIIATDYRVYSRNLRLDDLDAVAVVLIITSGIISMILFLAGVR